MTNPRNQMKLCKKRLRILETNGHQMIMGGPGSGKTTIALLKANRVILNGMEDGQSVLFLSFSKAAVQRILDSASNLLDSVAGKRVEIRTYHSFAWDILQSHGYLLSSARRLQILSPQDADVIKADLENLQWEEQQERLFDEEGRVTYDLFAAKAADILKRCQKLRDIYSAAYPVILVDEFQDTDNHQWSLVRALSKSSSVIALGDNGQRIYDWRPGVDETRLDQFAKELKASIFDFGAENNRSPTTGIASFGRALLNPKTGIRCCPEVSIRSFYANQFDLHVKLAVIKALGEARKRSESPDISVAVAGGSKKIVRGISDVLFKSQNARGIDHGPIEHDVLIDQSQVILAARVTAFLLESHAYDERCQLVRTLKLIADLHLSMGYDTNIANGNRMKGWARKIRDGGMPKVNLVDELRELLEKLSNAALIGSPTKDWMFVRKCMEDSDNKYLKKVTDNVRFLRILRRGSAIEERLSELWRGQGNYRGAMQAVEDAIGRERLLDGARPPARCTVMTMHQLKGREYDAVVLAECRHQWFRGREKESPYMKTRRLLQMSVTRARHYVIIVSPRQESTLNLIA